MPRANRYFLPGQIWHITHRCHEKSFLLGFGRDRRTYRRWLFEAKKRFGLCVLNYAVTCNHVHLLAKDTGEGVIARSLQLAAGRTAQEFNERKGRHGAFWEDRYHATAIEAATHLHRCLVYVDLNMVRAGVVRHPAEWKHGGYREIQDPPERYALIDLMELTRLSGFSRLRDFQCAHRQWVADALERETMQREERWSESIAVGSAPFVATIRAALGSRARHRDLTADGGMHVLRESETAYMADFGAENPALRPKNGPSRRETYVKTVP